MSVGCVGCVGVGLLQLTSTDWSTDWSAQDALAVVQDMKQVQVYDEEGVDRTPKQLVQRQMVSARPAQQPGVPSTLPGGPRTTASVSILGRHHRESRMGSRMSKLSESQAPLITEAFCNHMPTS